MRKAQLLSHLQSIVDAKNVKIPTTDSESINLEHSSLISRSRREGVLPYHMYVYGLQYLLGVDINFQTCPQCGDINVGADQTILILLISL